MRCQKSWWAVFAVMLALLVITGCGPKAPAAPISLLADLEGEGVTLTWAASSDATGYKVFKSMTSGGPYAEIAETAETEYAISVLDKLGVHYFVVKAFNEDGESGYSPEATATPEPDVSDNFESYTGSLAAPWSVVFDSPPAPVVQNDPLSASKALYDSYTGTYRHSGVTTSDCIISVWLREPGEDESTSFSLDARLTDSSRYTLALIKNTNELWIMRVIGGGSAPLLSAPLPAGFDFAVYHNVRFEVIGSSLKGYVDGVQVISTTDTGITGAGAASISVNNGSAYFDDFMVYYR